MFYKIHRGQVNTSLPYDLTCVPVYGRTRARDQSSLFIIIIIIIIIITYYKKITLTRK